MKLLEKSSLKVKNVQEQVTAGMLVRIGAHLEDEWSASLIKTITIIA